MACTARIVPFLALHFSLCSRRRKERGREEKREEGIGENRIGNSLFISLLYFSFAFATQTTCS